MSVLKDSLVIFTEGAKTNFKLHGYLLPVFAGVLDNVPRMFPVVWEKPDEKEAFAQKIQQWIAAGRLREFVMVSEAWAANIQDGEQGKVQEWLNTHGSLETWPDRKEVVIVQYCSSDEEIEYTADIIRGIIPYATKLSEWNINIREVKFNSHDFNTRFQGLFLRSKAGQN